ncbi:uncharacterized protein LOC128712247 [Anopheles marshallii]|uniref:uncharacterized protein LOC128712247 n=1 Tax=Anopheles marshallii TaxID=1521116 RepID=UPI00237B867A|nr:uncharacterized protein LOC128712247 [Anopheles marshallii]
MELITDTGKVLKAYQIINQQLVHEIQKKKIEIKMHEERYNATNEMLLQERQENKALRDMVRKLKDQMQVITKVIVSVQDQTENVYERINRPHELAERMMQNYTPRAQQVYERRRTENPPYVDEYAIAEENETSVVVENEDEEETNAQGVNNDTHANESGSVDADETFASNRSSDIRCSSGAPPLAVGSPLVQRLKRPSRNASFDESFETIDRERVFKLSRHSQERRKIYANIEENVTDLKSISRKSRMEIDEELSETLRNLSPVKMDDVGENMSCSSTENEKSNQMNESPRPDNNRGGHQAQLKKMASESMLSRIHRSTVVDEDLTEGSSSISRDETEMTVFNPAELVASCSTPVAKGSTGQQSEKDRANFPRRGRGRPRTRGCPTKARSETELHTLEMNPVVVLRPLTEKNIRAHEQKMRPNRKARPIRYIKECDISDSEEGSTLGEGNTWEPSSSMENLSTVSGESNRPRRRAAPKMLREPSLIIKLRRT